MRHAGKAPSKADGKTLPERRRRSPMCFASYSIIAARSTGSGTHSLPPLGYAEQLLCTHNGNMPLRGAGAPLRALFFASAAHL
mmetsp:Transcript_67527/g.162104  ORF Transcript_67527/g.162104 Transcript_67527/m.162104 type:complete len:83 (+) Transcript_67527:1727-1975(+)